MSIPVADQDAALAFYTTVLGCEVRHDVEAMPGARYVEVVPPGSDVGLVLLPPDSPLPMAVRLGTPDDDEVIRWEDVPPMFHFDDPDGNGLVYIEDRDET